MGAHLVEILAALDCKVIVTTRADREARVNIKYLKGNALDESFFNTLTFRKWDVIVDFMVYSTSEFKERSAKLLSATDHYIFLSSARVYADFHGRIRENSLRILDSNLDKSFLATEEYALSKARQEDILRQSGDNWTIVRPYITYGEERLQLGVFEKEGWLYRALNGRSIVFSSDIISKLTTLTYGRDVARALAAVIRHPYSKGEVYHITQSKAVSWGVVLEIYLRVLERKLKKRPRVVLLDLRDFSRCERAEHQIKYDRMYDRQFDGSKIDEILALESFKPLAQSLSECLETFLEDPLFLSIDWRSEAIKDRYCGEITNVREIPTLKQKIKYLFYRFIKIQ